MAGGEGVDVAVCTGLVRDEDIARLGSRRKGDHAQRQPNVALRTEQDGRQLVVNEVRATVGHADMEVVIDGAVQPLLHRKLIVEAEARLIDFQQSVHIVGRDDLKIECVTFLPDLFGRASAKKQGVGRHVEEVAPVVVDEVDAVVGAACQSVGHRHARFGTGVVLVGDVHPAGNGGEEGGGMFHAATVKWVMTAQR